MSTGQLDRAAPSLSPDHSGTPGALEKTRRGAKQKVPSSHWHLWHVHGRVVLSLISLKQSVKNGFSPRTPGCQRSRQRVSPCSDRGSRAEPGRVTVPGPGTRLMHHCPGCHRSHGDKWGRGPGSAPQSLPLRRRWVPDRSTGDKSPPGVTAELLLAGMCPIP